jgi:hypothetical protein
MESHHPRPPRRNPPTAISLKRRTAAINREAGRTNAQTLARPRSSEIPHI